MSDTWVSKDALGRQIENGDAYPKRRSEKKVGIFYFIWQGAHGYDHHSPPLPDQGVMTASETDTVSPYDISELLRNNPSDPQYGPEHAFHHWGQPYLGYYVANDEWVIRKHAQMISDAGIDTIIIDVTNAVTYLPQVKTICDVYTRMRKEGNTTPQIAFIINSNPKATLENLYNSFYKPELYKDLWFYWKGKPLLLCPPEGITPETEAFFTIRHSWFASSWPWFGDGKDKWTWADFYPQKAGWHESPELPEEVSVCAATHPTSNIGRSFHEGKQPEPPHTRSGEGLFFAEQFQRAIQIDPEFIFITGWNEWIAMRFINTDSAQMLGKTLKKGESFFVDQYNEEYSRDIEPMRGGFGDNFYYQMVDHIRKFKGVNLQPIVSKTETMTINGSMKQWEKVGSIYYDDKGDIVRRDHPGWGRIQSYKDDTGRNDIVLSKVATDGKSLFFYVQTAQKLSPYNDPHWMLLFIDVKSKSAPNWEGFQYVINNRINNASETLLQKSLGGWEWETVDTLSYAVNGNEMELAISLTSLGIEDPHDFTIDFKWIDNAVADGNIMECMEHGDTAPNGRFRYRFSFHDK